MTNDLPEPLYIDPELGIPIFDEPETTPMERWAPPCPLGHPQRPVSAHAYRDKLQGCLQLRVDKRPGVEGVCSVVVQESSDIVLVRVILCCPEGDADDESELWDCPTRVWLDDPLDGRTVIDVESGLRLPTYESKWS